MEESIGAKRKSKIFLIFSWVLGTLLFVYLLLRAIFVGPMHDELATLFYYIDYGVFWGKGMLIDANNHLLNSFLGKVCYSFFGDHIWAIRLPNVLSFLIFFYASYKISLTLKNNFLRYVLLLSFSCIPYVLDYFSLSRGYGLSMAFLFLGVYWAMQLIKSYNLWLLIGMLFSFLLAIYANLNVIFTAVIIIGYLLLKWALQAKKTHTWKPVIVYVILVLVFIIGLYIPVEYAFILKENGALYYGNLNGLWSTTGASLSELVLMSKAVFFKYLFLSLILFFVAFLLYKWRSSPRRILDHSSIIWITLFLGNLLILVALRWIMKINYPEDRVGMQLIFLLFGCILFVLDEMPKVSFLGIILLFVPILGFKGFNFNSTIYTPDAIMDQDDFDVLVKEVTSDKAFSLFRLQQLTYAYHVRKSSPSNFSIPSTFRVSTLQLDADELISSRTDFNNYTVFDQYKILCQNPITQQVIYLRREPYHWQIIKDSVVRQPEENEYSGMFRDLIDSSWKDRSKTFKFVVNCEVNIPELQRESLVFVVDKTYRDGTNDYQSFDLGWAAGKLHDYSFNHAELIQPNQLAGLKIYLYNPHTSNYRLLTQRYTLLEAE